ncbi:hypothetical protein Tco_0779668 [Tanacetum coccineum]
MLMHRRFKALSDHRDNLTIGKWSHEIMGPSPFPGYHSLFSLHGFNQMGRKLGINDLLMIITNGWMIPVVSKKNFVVHFANRVSSPAATIKLNYTSLIDCLQIRLDDVVEVDLQVEVGHLGTLLSNMEDRWVWDLNGEGVFRVKDVRILLDECFLPKAPTATRWVKYVPIKINVFAWKVFLDRKIPRTCSSVADWLRISSGSYAAGGIYHGRPLVHMLIGLIGSIPSD